MTGGPEQPSQPTSDGQPAAGGSRPATPGAAAASRPRRIGGRPLAARPAPVRPAPARPTAESDSSEVSLSKAAGEPPASAAPEDPTPTEAPEDTAASPEPAPAPAAVPTWLNWAPAGVLVAGAVVMAVLMVVFSHGVWWGPKPDATPPAARVNQAREQLLAAAKSCVVATNNYTYTNLDGYERTALACTTGALTGKLKTTIESLVKQNAPRLKAKQTAQISRGGIESVSPDGKQWTLLIFGQLSVVNANYPKGRTDPFGAIVRMERVGGKWLMSDLNTVSSPVQG